MKSPARIVRSKRLNKPLSKPRPLTSTPVRDHLIDSVKHVHRAGRALVAGASVLIEQAEGSCIRGELKAVRCQLDLAEKYLEAFRGMNVDFVSDLELGSFPFEPLRTANSADCDEHDREIEAWGIDDGPARRAADALWSRCQAIANALIAGRVYRYAVEKLRAPVSEGTP